VTRKAWALTLVLILLSSAVFAQFAAFVAGNPSHLPEKPPQIYIKPDGSIEPSSAPIQREGNTYTLTNDTEHSIVVQCSNIVFDGNGFSITQIPVNTSGFTIPAGWYPGIQVPDRIANVTIKNVKIHDCISGVSLENALNITLTNISISSIEKVVVFSGYSSNCTFSKNDLRGGTEGILLTDSKHIDISENTIASNRVGISCYSSTFPSNGADGFATCAYINIFGNNIASNSEAGISLRAYNVRVGYNTLANNNYGIQFTSNSYYILIYSNNFVSNTKHVKINILESGGDGTWVWDSGSSGNYWSDYTTKYPNAAQIDHTGIGDTPYVIDANNKDNYPLMKETSISPPYVIVDFPSPSPSASPSPTQTATSTPTPDTSTTPTDEQPETAEPAPTVYLTLVVVGCGVLLAFAGTAVLIYRKKTEAG
jgi:parallel beta-helix repeat protein